MNRYRIAIDFRRGLSFSDTFSGQNTDQAIAAALAAARAAGIDTAVERIIVSGAKRQQGEI